MIAALIKSKLFNADWILMYEKIYHLFYIYIFTIFMLKICIQNTNSKRRELIKS